MPEPDLTLFLVEDSDIDAMVVERRIQRLSLDLPVVRAMNGEEALELLRAATAPPRPNAPFVIVLDLNMPRMGGFEFLDALASDETLASDVPIFILTTSSSHRDMEQAKKYRINGYIVKPLTEANLTEVIESATGI